MLPVAVLYPPVMLGLIKQLLGRRYQPLNKITASKEAVVSNYQFLKGINKKISIAPVLKSNAYGHGIAEVARIVDKLEAPFLCVDSIYEAYQLLKLKVKTPILIMGYIDPQNLRVKKLPFSYCLYDLELAKAIDRYQPKPTAVHLFVDTGMNREGIKVSELADFIQELKQLPNVRIDGLMTHLASADNPQSQITKLQLQNFEKAKQICKQAKLKIKWFHLGGSMALLKNPDVKCNMVRVGKALYGAGDFPTEIKPALKLTSTLIQIKEIKKGQPIGYSETFKASKNMQIGILPIGYNDGVDRRLSNQGVVTINGTKCPIVGLISMNLTTIDVSSVENLTVGQEVTIYSDNQSDPNSVQGAAKLCQTIPLELLIHLNSTTRRSLVD